MALISSFTLKMTPRQSLLGARCSACNKPIEAGEYYRTYRDSQHLFGPPRTRAHVHCDRPLDKPTWVKE